MREKELLLKFVQVGYTSPEREFKTKGKYNVVKCNCCGVRLNEGESYWDYYARCPKCNMKSSHIASIKYGHGSYNESYLFSIHTISAGTCDACSGTGKVPIREKCQHDLTKAHKYCEHDGQWYIEEHD